MSNNKVLVSGATGFVGKNLCSYLERQGKECIPLPLREHNRAEYFPGQADALIHLAGKAHDTGNTSNAAAYFEVNTALTKKVFEAFLKSDIKDFVYFSSVKAVADTVDDVLTEEQSPAPLTPYGQSKQAAERYLLDQRLPPGRRLFIIRPCMIHGPGNKGNLNLLYNFVAKGIPYPLAAYKNARSFLSIDNLCYVISEILRRPEVAPGVYNVADDEAVSTNHLIVLLSGSFNKKPRLLSVSPAIINAIARLGDILHLPLNSERLKKLTEKYVVSNRKIKSALGIESMPLTAEEGLKRTFQSFR